MQEEALGEGTALQSLIRSLPGTVVSSLQPAAPVNMENFSFD